MFFNKKSNFLEWNTDHPLDQYNNIDISDYLIPLNKNKPEWFSKLKGRKNDITGISNIKTCPSVLDLFKNSLTLISPCDFSVEVSQMGWKVSQMPFDWLKIDSHTATSPGLYTQMGYDFNQNFFNLKFNIPIIISPTRKKVKFIFLSTFFNDPVSDIIIPPGIATLLPENPLHLNLNSFVDLTGLKGSESLVINFRQGQPLSNIYFPDGIPKLVKNEKLKYKPRKTHYLDWSNREKNYDSKVSKCPFHK